jgi:hypothetical protein
MYIVEVRLGGDGLAQPMADIRTWLDHQRIQPSVFRISLMPGGTIFHLEFKAASDAEVFAQAFGGQVIGDERSGTVAALAIQPKASASKSCFMIGFAGNACLSAAVAFATSVKFGGTQWTGNVLRAA